MLGSHLSIAGGMVNALREAKRLKMECVQVFTKNQRQWSAKPQSDSEISEWLGELRSMGWDSCGAAGETEQPARVVSHNTYLINMASPQRDLWEKSVAAQRIEIERCEALHIPLCVAHPGAHLTGTRAPGDRNNLCDQPTPDELAGLKRIAEALDQIHRDLPGYRTVTCLETTVGSGTNLGYCFRHLAIIRELVREPQRVAYCFDTCHVLAAGYDLSTPEKVREVLDEWDAICGLANLRVFHFNDSEGERGSRRDRHAHIGEGCCGRACFEVILNHPNFQAVPKILETPKGVNAKGLNFDVLNLRRLRRMAKPANPADNPSAKPSAAVKKRRPRVVSR
jgi:deoxyribonuclease IV